MQLHQGAPEGLWVQWLDLCGCNLCKKGTTQSSPPFQCARCHFQKLERGHVAHSFCEWNLFTFIRKFVALSLLVQSNTCSTERDTSQKIELVFQWNSARVPLAKSGSEAYKFASNAFCLALHRRGSKACGQAYVGSAQKTAWKKHGHPHPNAGSLICNHRSGEPLGWMWNVFDTQAVAKGDVLGQRLFPNFKKLNDWAQKEGRALFHIVLKHHMLYHLVKDSLHCNPKCHSCWQGEDFVGKISQMCHSVSFGTKCQRITVKLAAKYARMLHLLLTRDGVEWEKVD